MPNDELQTLWQQQEVPPMKIDIEQLRRRSTRLYSCVNARNLRETVAGGLAGALLAWTTIGEHDPVRLSSSLLLIAGMIYVMFHLWRHGRAAALPADLGALDAVSFHRRELLHQRDLLSGVFWWYLAPFLPGLVLSAVSGMHRSWIVPAALTVFVVAAFWFVMRINRGAVHRLDRELAELAKQEQ
jgi:hypothetical protein